MTRNASGPEGLENMIKRMAEATARSMIQRISERGDCERGDCEFDWAPGYASDCCDEPAEGILFANWNPKQFGDVLTRIGVPNYIPRRTRIESEFSHLLSLIELAELDFGIEWSDEWCTCDDCQRAFRISPDCYSWTPNSFVWYESGEHKCQECAEADPEEMEAELMNTPTRADSFGFNWGVLGWFKLRESFESGLHLGQNDNPESLLARINKVGKCDVLFQIESKGQFDVQWCAWVRPVNRPGFEFVADNTPKGVEVWQSRIALSACCDTPHPQEYAEAVADQPCFTCEKPATFKVVADRWVWWWWSCQPGCLPDSNAMGPFPCEALAVDDARGDC